jgi:hypothetical protein
MITCILGPTMFTGRFSLRLISSRTMKTSTPKVKDMSTLRPSASLVVVNSSNEVLLVHRNPKATSFAGMHVRRSWIATFHLDTIRRYSLEEITTRNRMNPIK